MTNTTHGVAIAISMSAATTRVWTALTQQTDRWWPPSARMTGTDSTITLEARAGGRLFEQSAAGVQLMWATVVGVVPESSLDLVGYLAARYGGPAVTLLHLDLQPESDSSCTLHITDSVIGDVGANLIAQIESGWQEIFSALRESAETNPADDTG